MTRLWLAITTSLLLSGLASAQNPVADANDQIEFDQAAPSLQDVQNFGYRYYLDNDPVGVNAVVICAGTTPLFQCSMDLPALSPGTHTIQITASNVAGESPKSIPFVFDFVITPVPPAGMRIIRR